MERKGKNDLYSSTFSRVRPLMKSQLMVSSMTAYDSSLSFPTFADGMGDENSYQMGFDSGFQRATMLMSGMGEMNEMRGMEMGMMHADSDEHTSNTVISAAPRDEDMKKPSFVLHFFYMLTLSRQVMK